MTDRIDTEAVRQMADLLRGATYRNAADMMDALCDEVGPPPSGAAGDSTADVRLDHRVGSGTVRGRHGVPDGPCGDGSSCRSRGAGSAADKHSRKRKIAPIEYDYVPRRFL